MKQEAKMRWNLTCPAHWSPPFSLKATWTTDTPQVFQRSCRHILYNIVPTLLILIGVSWVTLLATEKIYQSKTTAEVQLSLDQLYAEQ